MRWALPVIALFFLAHCSTVSSYDANADQSNSSLKGSQGGGGVQTSIWSTDPGQKTITNQNPTQ